MKRYRYRKITPEILENIKILNDKGLTQVAIAKKLEVSSSCVLYWGSEGQREKAIARAQKSNKKLTKEKIKIKNQKRAEYSKNYLNDRYNNDTEFRDKFKKMVMKSFNKRKEVWAKQNKCSNCGREKIDKSLKTCERCRGK